MNTLKTAVVALCAWVVVAGGIGLVASQECPTEDGGTVCTWYADRQGNGHGESFTHVGPVYVYWG